MCACFETWTSSGTLNWRPSGIEIMKEFMRPGQRRALLAMSKKMSPDVPSSPEARARSCGELHRNGLTT
jgi:hypothetical protein